LVHICKKEAIIMDKLDKKADLAGPGISTYEDAKWVKEFVPI
jgi:hypothetical protein